MAFYDVVVVGASSAGCAVVNRLCRSSELAVCLVEAGPDYGPLSSGQWPPELLNCHRMPSTRQAPNPLKGDGLVKALLD